jgi:hypothetical protein
LIAVGAAVAQKELHQTVAPEVPRHRNAAACQSAQVVPCPACGAAEALRLLPPILARRAHHMEDRAFGRVDAEVGAAQSLLALAFAVGDRVPQLVGGARARNSSHCTAPAVLRFVGAVQLLVQLLVWPLLLQSLDLGLQLGSRPAARSHHRPRLQLQLCVGHGEQQLGPAARGQQQPSAPAAVLTASGALQPLSGSTAPRLGQPFARLQPPLLQPPRLLLRRHARTARVHQVASLDVVPEVHELVRHRLALVVDVLEAVQGRADGQAGERQHAAGDGRLPGDLAGRLEAHVRAVPAVHGGRNAAASQRTAATAAAAAAAAGFCTGRTRTRAGLLLRLRRTAGESPPLRGLFRGERLPLSLRQWHCLPLCSCLRLRPNLLLRLRLSQRTIVLGSASCRLGQRTHARWQ